MELIFLKRKIGLGMVVKNKELPTKQKQNAAS